MLKVYYVRSYVSIDGGDWELIDYGGHSIRDDKPTEKIIFENYTLEQCHEYLKENTLGGIWPSYTFFRKKPMIYIEEWFYEAKRYTSFDTISYKHVYEEWESVSLDWIMKHLSAEQCIQYLKEHGITTCPILK